MMGLIKKTSHKSYAGKMYYSVHWFKMWTTIYWIIEENKGDYLTTLCSNKIYWFFIPHLHLLVGKYFYVKQKEIQHFHMLTHDEYMKKLTTLSTSYFNLVEVPSTITIWMVLYKSSETSKL